MTFRPLLVLSLALLGAVGVAAFVQDPAPDERPPLPANPHAAAVELLHARPFVLDEPYTHVWRAERPEVSSGFVVVLGVDPELVVPRQTLEPVLYAGEQTVERLNHAQGSGHLVAIVPAASDASLAELPFFFGSPALPEQVDATQARAELATARATGLAAPSAATLAARTESPVRFRDQDELHLFAADLIAAWAPDEIELADGMRAPRVR